MGCDIHCYSEVRKFHYDDKSKEHGVWVSDDKWSINHLHYLYPEDDEKKLWVDLNDRVISDRWYGLFAVLAGVRDQWGIEPISPPKGLPEDTCEQIRLESEKWERDGHSHSWLTLREMEQYPLNHYWFNGSNLTLLQEWERILNVMRSKCKKHHASTDDVRVVFWFDN